MKTFEISFKTQKKLLIVIIIMVAAIWVVLGRNWIETERVKARLEERQLIENIILKEKDSVSKIIIKQQENIIHKLDSVKRVLYLKNIYNGH